MSDLNSNTIENEEQDENKSGEGDESDEDPSQLPSSNNTFPTQDNGETKKTDARIPKGFWTPEEDERLRFLIQSAMSKSPFLNWKHLATQFVDRSSKQCRERWTEYLDPKIDSSPFTPDEDAIILQAQAQVGNRWKDISEMIKGKNRTPTAIKVRWHFLQRRLQRQQAQHAKQSFYRTSMNAAPRNILQTHIFGPPGMNSNPMGLINNNLNSSLMFNPNNMNSYDFTSTVGVGNAPNTIFNNNINPNPNMMMPLGVPNTISVPMIMKQQQQQQQTMADGSSGMGSGTDHLKHTDSNNANFNNQNGGSLYKEVDINKNTYQMASNNQLHHDNHSNDENMYMNGMGNSLPWMSSSLGRNDNGSLMATQGFNNMPQSYYNQMMQQASPMMMGGLQNVAYMNNMRNGMSSNGTYGNMGNMGMMSMNSMNMSGSYAPQSAFGMMPQNGEMPSQILQNSNGTFGAVPSENIGDSSRSSQNDYANRPPVLDADTSRQVKSDPGSSNDSNIANYQENNTRSPSVRTNNSAENTDQNMNQKQFNENGNVNSDVVMDEEYEMRKAQYQQYQMQLQQIQYMQALAASNPYQAYYWVPVPVMSMMNNGLPNSGNSNGTPMHVSTGSIPNIQLMGSSTMYNNNQGYPVSYPNTWAGINGVGGMNAMNPMMSAMQTDAGNMGQNDMFSNTNTYSQFINNSNIYKVDMSNDNGSSYFNNAQSQYQLDTINTSIQNDSSARNMSSTASNGNSNSSAPIQNRSSKELDDNIDKNSNEQQTSKRQKLDNNNFEDVV